MKCYFAKDIFIKGISKNSKRIISQSRKVRKEGTQLHEGKYFMNAHYWINKLKGSSKNPKSQKANHK